MDERVVLYEVDGAVATITLNRPRKLNALSDAVVEGLVDSLGRAEADDDVRVVVLRGAGGNFSAGFDMSEEAGQELSTALAWSELLGKDVAATMRLWSLPKPTIAAVAGYCLAGACELAMACDLIVCAEDARFGEPEIRYGSGPVTLLMPFVLGQKKTNELLFTGGLIDAEDALRHGLVNRVVPIAELDAAVDELAAKIAPTPLPILRLTKLALQRAYEAMGLRATVDANLYLSSILNAADLPEQREFDRIAREQGLRAALAWRDERYCARLADPPA
jgi:enoyl-CoA hydratase